MSNLLDRSSLVLTPTAYNNGEALCIKPDDASGDFTFSRNSAATRVNAQGLVENVQILSSNLVQNGDFSEEGVEEVSNGSFSQEGSELITNGNFSNGSTDWILDSGWSVSDNKALCDGTNLAYITQTAVLTTGKSYKVQFDIVDYTSGSIKYRDNGFVSGQSFSGVGSYTDYVVAGGGQFRLMSENFIGSIDNVSCVEVGQDWLFAGGSEITEQGARINNTITGVNAYIRQSNSNFTIGKSFVLEYDVVATNGTTLAIEQTSSIALNTSTVGSNRKIYFQWDIASTGLVIKRLTAGTDVTITNISVKEVGQNWVLASGWEIGDDKAVANTTGDFVNLYQNSVFVVGKTYKTTFTIVDYTQGSVRLTQGGIDVSGFQNAVGTYTAYFTATQTSLYMQGYQSFIGSITNITIIEITDDTSLPRINYEGFSYQDALGSEEVVNGDFATDTDWSKSTGWTIANGKANSNTSAYRTLAQNIPIVLGKKYKVFYDVVSYTSGSVSMTLGADSGALRSAVGSYSEIIEYNNFYSSSGPRSGGSGFVGSIDNVSVKEYLGQEVVPDSGCGSWLFEPQSTNTVTYSEDYSQWNQLGAAPVLTTGQLSPSGELNATKISGTIGSTFLNLGASSSTTATRTIYAKSVSGTGTACLLSHNSNTNNLFTLTEDWQRFELTGSNATGGTAFYIDFRDNSQTLSEFIVWGAQSEELTYATSYIPTNGEANGVTRNQDVCTNGGSLASINSTEGVLYAEIAALANDGTNKVITLSKSSDWSNRTFLRYDAAANSITYRYLVNGSIKANLVHTLSNATILNKIACKWELNNFKLYVNGLNVGQDLSGSVISANSLDKLNFNDGLGTNKFFGNTKCLAVWPEALSDSELQSLTTI